MDRQTVLDAFTRTYSDRRYLYTTLVRHRGTLISLAMDDMCHIYYSVLDMTQAEGASPLDVDCWLDNPRELRFPDEIVRIGLDRQLPTLLAMPEVQVGSGREYPFGALPADERDLFLSTTARLGAKAPMQAISDGRYVYLLRQAIAGDDGGNLTAPDGGPIVDRTLLVDRFVFTGSDLQPKIEVRYRRSRSRFWPQSAKDSLGARDMDERPFYEPTQELTFVRHLVEGRFAALLLPTQVAEGQRWQLFAYDEHSQAIDAFNIERDQDGLLNPAGTRHYTCPRHPDVFESELSYGEGRCTRARDGSPGEPCGEPLVPVLIEDGYPTFAVALDGEQEYVRVASHDALNLGPDLTLEAWVKPSSQKTRTDLVYIISRWGAADVFYALALTPAGKVVLSTCDGKSVSTLESDSESGGLIPDDVWSHIAGVRQGDVLRLYVNGRLVNGRLSSALAQSVRPQNSSLDLCIGASSSGVGRWMGGVDEVRIWKCARSQEELLAHRQHRLVGREPGLVGYWPMGDGLAGGLCDETDNALHGVLCGGEGQTPAPEFLTPGAPVGAHPGVRRARFSFVGREIAAGLSALLYYPQEPAPLGPPTESKPLKRTARVMLAAVTRGADAPQNEIAVLDLAVSRQGGLARADPALTLPRISRAAESGIPFRELLQRIAATRSECDRLQREVSSLNARLAVLAIQIAGYALGGLFSSSAKRARDQAKREWSACQREASRLREQLRAQENELARLLARLHDDSPLPLRLLHVDALGLGVAGGLLDFCLAESAPFLFDSANGCVGLYYVDSASDQDQSRRFLVAYLDTRAERARCELATEGDERLICVAHHLGADMDKYTVEISGDDAGVCEVSIAGPTGLTELWEGVPRGALALADVLNGAREGDLQTVAVEGPPAHRPFQRSRLVSVDVNALPREVIDGTSPSSKLANQSVKLGGSVATPGVAWVGKPPGTTLHFAPPEPEWVALQLDGVDDYVYVPGFEWPVGGPVTVEFWAKVEAADVRQSSAFTVGEKDIPRRFHVHLPWSDKRLYWDYGNWQGMGRVWTEYGPYLGHWTHVALVSTGLSPKPDEPYMCIYLNGQLAARCPTSDGPDMPLTGLWIGKWNVFHNHKGALDEFRIWDRCRSEEEIRRGMRRRVGAGEPGLVGCWRFHDGTVRDDSPYGRHGQIEGQPQNTLSPIEPELEGAQALDPSQLDAPADLAIEAWIRPQSNLRTGWVVDQRTPDSTYRLGLTAAPEGEPKLMAQVGERALRARETLPWEAWTHVAAVHKQAYALQFDGQDDYLECASQTTLGITGDLTLELSLRVDGLSPTRSTLLSKGVLGAGSGQRVPYALQIDHEGYAHLVFEDKNGVSYDYRSTKAIQVDLPSRLAVTRAHRSEVSTTQGASPGVQVEQWDDVIFYLGRADVALPCPQAGASRHTGASAGGGDGALIMGLGNPKATVPLAFQGVLGQVRIWNTARAPADICSALQGDEQGLVACWRFEEGEGHVAHDVVGTSQGRLWHGVEWVKDPDPQASPLTLYVDGVAVPCEETAPYALAESTFRLGAGFVGEMDEVRIWRRARTQEQIQDNLFRRLANVSSDLIAYYPLEPQQGNILKDLGPRESDLYLEKVPAGRISWEPSTAPLGLDAPLVRSVLAGIETPFNASIEGMPAVQEYGDMQYDLDGNLVSVLKRCYAYIQDGRWRLLTGYKVGDLSSEWVGQVQFAPQLIGFIEGAPPVPSENLTDPQGDYAGASAVEMTEAQSSTYTYSASRDTGFDMSLEASVTAGFKSETKTGGGFGLMVLTSMEDTNIKAGIKTTFENSLGWLDDASVGSGRTTTKASRLELQGQHRDGRFVPRNVGYALVQSEVADVFALRLRENGALVCYQMRPNPDIPRDWNIITFPIDAHYIKQGTLDGRVGSEADEDYPQAGQGYNPDVSYFKPVEAYALKKRIEREEEERRIAYEQYRAGAIGRRQAAAHFSESDLGAGALAENLPQAERRNLVNTYVWTADGGFFAETQEALDVVQESMGGSYSFKGMAGATLAFDVAFSKVAVGFQLEALFGGHLNLTVAKTAQSETRFALQVELDVERELGEVPGKVDAYRFMTFYLQPASEHFDAFYSKVVDPIWLAEDDSANAVALRQAQADGQGLRPPCWRVLHRVTFVSRILEEFKLRALPEAAQRAVERPALENALAATGISSRWALLKRLEPYVKSRPDRDLDGAVRAALREQAPSLEGHAEEIIRQMRLYLGLVGAP